MNKRILNPLLAIVLFLSLFSSFPMPTEAKEGGKTHVATKIFDLIIVRPISLGVAAASTGVFLATLPFTFPAGVSAPSARIFVEAPWRFAGSRYLGEWSHYRDGNPITVISDEGP